MSAFIIMSQAQQHRHFIDNSSSLFPPSSTTTTLSTAVQKDSSQPADFGSFTTDSSQLMDHSQHHHHHHSSAAVDGTAGFDGGEVDAAGVSSGDGGPHNMHDMMDDMMKMFFHTGAEDNVLIYGWSTGPTWAAALTCLLFAALAIVYEALKFVRERLDQQYALIQVRKSSPTSYTVNVRNGGNTSPPPPQTAVATQNAVTAAPALTFAAAMGSWVHWVQAVLHMAQVALGYLLMLVFMYFNIWLCLSIVLGSGVGYLLFGWARKLRIVTDDDGHCC